MGGLLAQRGGGFERGGDDGRISSAAAEMTAEDVAQLLFGGSGLSREMGVSDIRIPAVQKPHCSAWRRRKAACRTERRSGDGARPSTVRRSQSMAWTARVRQARAGRPSMTIVQAPQTPCSQPTCVPVAPSR